MDQWSKRKNWEIPAGLGRRISYLLEGEIDMNLPCSAVLRLPAEIRHSCKLTKVSLGNEESHKPPSLPQQHKGTDWLPAEADCLLTELKSNEPLRRNCTIYRPWYSPYSYFVCVDKDSQVDSCSFPDMQRGNGMEIPVDSHQAEETLDSVSSSSDSLEKTYPQDNSSRKARSAAETKDCITSQDILLVSKWQPRQQNGYKCMACCRMFPTLHSLKTHIKCGSKEGFSCKVYYHKLKALWEKEHKCQPSNRPADSGNNSSSSKMLK